MLAVCTCGVFAGLCFAVHPLTGVFICFTVGGDYMANLDLPPSSSEDEGEEAEEDSQDAAGRASNDLDRPEQQTAAAHRCPDDALASRTRPESHYAGTCTNKEGCSSPEMVSNIDHDLKRQERSEPTTSAEPGGDVVQDYSSHANQPVEGHMQHSSNTGQDIHALSLATSLKNMQLTQKPV